MIVGSLPQQNFSSTIFFRFMASCWSVNKRQYRHAHVKFLSAWSLQCLKKQVLGVLWAAYQSNGMWSILINVEAIYDKCYWHSSEWWFEETWKNPQRREAICLLQMSQDILSKWWFKDTWEDPQRKAICLFQMWRVIQPKWSLNK